MYRKDLVLSNISSYKKNEKVQGSFVNIERVDSKM